MDRTVELLIDEMCFKKKPTSNDVALIQTRLKNEKSLKKIPLNELTTYIGRGQTLVLSVPKDIGNGAKNSNFKSQELFFLDIDNTDNEEIVLPETLIKLLNNYGVEIYGYYHTFSSTPELPKFRLILVSDKVIENVEEALLIINTLINLVPQADKACKNTSRLFYGTDSATKEIHIINPDATISYEQMVELSKKISDDENKNNLTSYNKSNQKNIVRSKEIRELEKNFDLFNYMKQYFKVKQNQNNSSNYTTFENCFCGHNNCLTYYKDSNRFYCYSSSYADGGTIVDFIKEIHKKTEEEAINYLKYDLCKLPRTDDEPDTYLEMVKKQLEDNNIELKCKLESLDWVTCYTTKTGILIEDIDCPMLYKFIAENMYYIFVKSHATGGVLRYFYTRGYYKLVSDDEVKGYIKSLIPLPLQKSSKINEVFNLLCTDLKFVDISKLNNNENIINFENGCLNIWTGELKPHDPNILSTIKIPCNYYEYVPEPDTHYFEKYIDNLTDGNKELRTLILQGMGVVISNVKGWKFKKGWIMYGAPHVGKSKIKELLAELVGRENTCNIDMKEMETTFGKFEILNKRLVGHNDMSFMSIPEVSVFKQAVAGDQIHAQPKGRQAVNFVFNGVLWYCANQLPKFAGDRGQHVYDRIIPIECMNEVPENKRDGDLLEHLLEEKEYICYIAIKELRKIINKNGIYKYDIPEICEQWKKKYQISNHSFLLFMEECVVERTGTGINDECTCRKLYDVYREWCKINNNKGYHETKGEVFNLLDRIGKGERVKTNGGYWFFKDITLSEDAKQEYSYIYGSERQEPPTLKDVGIKDEQMDLPF